MVPFFILVTEFADWSFRTSRLDFFFLLNRLGMKTHNRDSGWLSNQTKSYTLPTIFSTRGLRLESFVLRGSPIARSLRYRCSETCLSSRLTTMAEAAGRGRREQPGYFVCSAEFLPRGEEGPPSHQGQLRCRRRGLRSDHGPLARTAFGGREQSYAARERRSDFPCNAERHPFGAAYRSRLKISSFRKAKSLTPSPKRWRNGRVPA